MVKRGTQEKGKEASVKAPSLEDFSVGDLVWASVKGYPRWPGQAADPEKAAEKTLAIRKPGTLLVYFFGDASYGWFQPETLAPFEPLLEQLSKVKTKQPNFRRAVEEGKEVLDRRAGREPATQHAAWDALDESDERNQPGYQQEDGSEGEGSRLGDLRPPELTAEVAEQCTAGAALAWLHAVARDPHMEPTEAAQPQVAAAARLVFSLVRAQLARPDPKPVAKKRTAAPQTKPGKAAQQASATPPPPAKRRKVDSSAAEPKAEKRASKPGAQRAARSEPEPLEAGDAEEDSADELIDLGEGLTAAQRRAFEQHVWSQQAQEDRRAAAVKRGRGNMERELRVQLPDVGRGLATIAREPLAFLDGRIGSAGVAVLRWREAVYAKSELQKTGEVGEVLLEALGGGGAAWARKKRAETGVAPDAELEHVGKAAGDQYRCYQDASYAPAEREAFDQQLAAFYESHSAVQVAPVLDHQPLDLWGLFRVVAAAGGYQAVSARRQWGKLTREVRPECTSVAAVATQLVKHYRKLLLAFEAHAVETAGTPVEMRTVERGKAAARKSPGQAAEKAARKVARKAAKATAQPRSLAETPEGAALGFGDAPATSSSSSEGEEVDPASSEEADSDRDAAVAAHARQAEGRAAEQGMGPAASKRARLHAAAAARRKGRPQPQEQQPDPLAKRQAMERTTKMLADFDNLNSSGGSRPGSITASQGAPPPRQPAARREPQQARPADNDRRKTIVLRFPKGFPLPSQSQLLLAGANSGQLSHKDIYVFSKSYVACLDYSSVEAARKAEHWFVNHVDRHFKVARNETVRVTREMKREQRDPTQRSTGNAGRGAASSRATGPAPPLLAPSLMPPAPAAAAPANIGVPFDPRAGVPYVPLDTKATGAGAPAQPFDPRRGSRPPETTAAAPPPAAAQQPYDPRRGGIVAPPQPAAQPAAQALPQQYDPRRPQQQPPQQQWPGSRGPPPPPAQQPSPRHGGRAGAMYSQAAMPPPAAYAYAAPPYSSQPTSYSSGYGATGGAYGNGPPPPPAAAAPAPPRSGTDSPSNVLLPVGLDLAALLQSVQQPGPPAAAPPPPAGGRYGSSASQQQGVSLAHGMQPQKPPPPQPAVQPSAQEPGRDVQAELQMLLARLHGNG